ncbi:MAG TPA: exonuclease domain-containing protein [Candidatus Krumholzibacteria bacterium]|nr:exonuclease domain-containing protein [Candidatus Krumholzibacteria bacterium]
MATSTIDHARPLSDLHFVAFDTETTGLVASTERVIELSGVRFSFDGEIDRFESLIDPQQTIPPDSIRMHGIQDADVKGQPLFADAVGGFLDLIEDSVVLAHNAAFDVGFLAHEAHRSARKMPRVPVVDTVEISRALRDDLPNHKLETISKALNCPAPTYHRALADSVTLMNVFLGLVGGMADRPLHELFALTSGVLTFGPDERLWMWLPPELGPLEEALVSGGRVNLLYEPEGRRSETHEVTPRGWIRRTGATFLVARCERDHTDRNFRLDWITRAQYAQATLF